MKLFSLLCFLPALAFGADSYVSVRGEGEVRVKPEKALILLSVQSKGADAKTAQNLNAKEMSRVQKLLKSDFGIAEKDLQTTGLSLNPEYRYEQNGKQRFVGFQASHSLTVTVRKLDEVGGILDRVVGKGTEELSVLLNHVQFDTERKKELEITALGFAMENARARAEALAKFAKRGLKSARRISDSSVQMLPPSFPMAKSMAMRADLTEAQAGGTSVSAGEITVTANVAVDYDLE